MKNIDWLDYKKSFKALGFTDEQVSIMVESVQNVASNNNEMSTVKLDEILGEMKKYSSLEDETYVVKKKINEAEEDLDTEEEPTDEEPVEEPMDTEEVDAESEVEEPMDTEEVEPTDEEPSDEFEDDLGAEDVTADETDEIESDETENVEDDMEDEDSEDEDMEDETENELEDETEYDEENESEDYDELNSDNIEYSKAFIQAIEDRAWSRGYAMGYQDKDSLGSIMSENKQLIDDVKKILVNESKKPKSDLKSLVETKNRILGKTSKSDLQIAKEIIDESKNVKVQTKVTTKVESKVESKVQPKVETKPATPKSDKKVVTESIEDKMNKKVKVSVKEELSARDNIFAKLYEEIEVPSMTSPNANAFENSREKSQIMSDKKEDLIEKYLNGLTDIKKAELRPLLNEMAKTTESVKQFNNMLSLMPKSVNSKVSPVNESIEKSKDIYNSNSVESYINDATMKYFKMFNN